MCIPSEANDHTYSTYEPVRWTPTTFKLLPLNDREAKHYPEGAMELKRQVGKAQAQVWVITPGDMVNLLTLLAKNIGRKFEG